MSEQDRLLRRIRELAEENARLREIEVHARRTWMTLRASTPFLIDARGDDYCDAIQALEAALAKVPVKVPGAM